MKNRNCSLLFVVLAAVGMMFLTACNDLFDTLDDVTKEAPKKETPKKNKPKKDDSKLQPIAEGYGRVTITINSREAGRTIKPADPDTANLFEKIKFTFTNTGTNTPLTPKEVTDGDFTFELPVGNYSLLVQAYNDDQVVASGSTKVGEVIEITNAGNTPADIKLTAASSGNGYFTYSITYPKDATLNMILNGFSLNPTETSTATTNTYANTTGETVPAGSYLLTVTVDDGTSSTGFVEVVRIYPSLTTNLPTKVYTTTDLVEKVRYDISFSPSSYSASLIEGYDPITPVEVEITNTGNVPTGDLRVRMTGEYDSSFKLTGLTDLPDPSDQSGSTTYKGVASIPKGNSVKRTFYIAPEDGKTPLSGGYHAVVEFTNSYGFMKQFGVSFTVEAAVYAISLTPDTDKNFTNTTPYEVTIKNEGNVATGALSVTLVNPKVNNVTGAVGFTLAIETGGSGSTLSISSIPKDDDVTFTVAPASGLTMGSTYTATVKVSGGNGISDETFNVSYYVPKYEISLSPGTDKDFGTVTVGYGAQSAHSVTINNVGDKATGVLTIALSGGDSSDFILSTSSISDIAQGSNDSFTVVPKPSLPEGEYTETVTVSGGNGIEAKSFDVSFIVAARSISINRSGTVPFISQTSGSGYGSESLSVVITNTSDVATGALTVALSDNTYFTLGITTGGSVSGTDLSIYNIANKNGTTTFTVATKTGLSADSAPYTATVTVSGTDITSRTFTVSFKVNPPPGASIGISWDEHDDPVIAGGSSITAGQTLTLSVEQNLTSYSWSIGGTPAPGVNNAYSYSFSSWITGTFEVSVVVVKDSKEYSSTIQVLVGP